MNVQVSRSVIVMPKDSQSQVAQAENKHATKS